MYRLAELLGQPVSVIEKLPASEIAGWEGYFIIRDEEIRKQEARAKAQQKGQGLGRRGGGGRTFGGGKVPDM